MSASNPIGSAEAESGSAPELGAPAAGSASDAVGSPPAGRANASLALPYPTRYPWHVRWFVIVSVFCIVTRSAFNIRMHKVNWATQLSMYTLPYGVPSSKERREIEEGKSKRYATLSKRFEASGESFLRFANPFPQEKTRTKIKTSLDWVKYTAVWLHSRMEFVGRLVGIEERWTMYSPTVAKVRTVVRAVLRYQDGSTMEARAKTEPVDLSHFFRPFSQRRLQFDINLPSMEGTRLGWARYLARRHPENQTGAKLVAIDMYKVSYKLPDLGMDYAKHWRSGNGRRVKGDPFWRFDVASNKGKSLEKENAKKAKAPEGKARASQPAARPPTPEPDPEANDVLPSMGTDAEESAP